MISAPMVWQKARASTRTWAWTYFLDYPVHLGIDYGKSKGKYTCTSLNRAPAHPVRCAPTMAKAHWARAWALAWAWLQFIQRRCRFGDGKDLLNGSFEHGHEHGSSSAPIAKHPNRLGLSMQGREQRQNQDRAGSDLDRWDVKVDTPSPLIPKAYACHMCTMFVQLVFPPKRVQKRALEKTDSCRKIVVLELKTP